MNQPKQLHQIEIVGVMWYIDTKLRELRQVDNPHNRITENDIKDEGDFLSTLMDTRTKSVHKGGLVRYDDPNYERVYLPDTIFETFEFNIN